MQTKGKIWASGFSGLLARMASALKIKGKLRSRNILSYMKAHTPSVSKMVVIWCSTDLNFSSGSSLKSLKITTLEHQRPPS